MVSFASLVTRYSGRLPEISATEHLRAAQLQVRTGRGEALSARPPFPTALRPSQGLGRVATKGSEK